MTPSKRTAEKAQPGARAKRGQASFGRSTSQAARLSLIVPQNESMPAPRLRVLFVCSKNQWRSPTAEHIYRNDARLEVRSAGVKSEAKRRLSESDLCWADVVFAMEREHKKIIVDRFSHLELPEIEVLSIPDEFQYMQPELQIALRDAIDPELEARLTR